MAVQFKDYYALLGVAKTATADEIKKAFRQLARKHHPDLAKTKDKAAAEAKFKEINEAYEVLGEPEKRAKYDQLGPNWNQPGGFPGGAGFGGGAGGMRAGGGGFDPGEAQFGGTGFSDFFESIFGGMGRGAGKAYGGFKQAAGGAFTPPKGNDVEADIMVSLDEALHGSTRQISLRRTGETKTETYQVRIPAGVHEGQRIRLAGQGGESLQGGKAGDLFLNVRLERHPDFEVEGSDLVHDAALAPWQAVLGAEVKVPTLDGFVNVKIPSGTQPGGRLRLKGRGLPKSGGERGDLYVKIELTIPKTLTEKQRELWQSLAREG